MKKWGRMIKSPLCKQLHQDEKSPTVVALYRLEKKPEGKPVTQEEKQGIETEAKLLQPLRAPLAERAVPATPATIPPDPLLPLPPVLLAPAPLPNTRAQEVTGLAPSP